MTTFVEDYRPIFMVVTFGFLGFAFYLTYRPRGKARNAATGASAGVDQVGEQGRTTIMSLNKAMLWTVTVIAVVFLLFPQTVTDLFESSNELVTEMDEMEQSVLAIEGMT